MKHNPETNPGSDRLHEMLCAYLLGEANPNERAEVEQALAGSAELRDERERLEQTLGLVRGAFPGGEALSELAFADVLAKAQGQASLPGVEHATAEHATTARPRFVLLRPVALRAAAAITVVGVGAWAFLRDKAHGPADTAVARAERAQDFVRDDLGDDLGDALGTSPAVDSLSKSEADAAAQNEPSRQAAEERAKSDLRRDGKVADRAAGQAGEKKEAIHGLGYAGDEPDEELASLEGFEVPRYAGGVAPGAQAPTPAAPAEQRYLGPPTAVVQESLDSEDSLTVAEDPEASWRSWWGNNKDAYLDVQAKVHSGGVLTGADNFFLGRGERPGMASSASTGAYKGAGDTVPPGGGVAAGGAVSAGKEAGGRAAEREQGPTYYTWRNTQHSPVAGDEGASRSQLSALGYSGAEYEQGWDGVRQRKSLTFGSEAEREAWIAEQCRVRIHQCYPRPQESPRDMYFRFWGDNAFQLTELDRLSTFSVDVDTASYTLARRYLNEGRLPTKAQIRTEEFLNYFDADLAPPGEGTFAIYTELAPSRFGGDAARSLLRVGIRGREVARDQRKPLSLTFVIDTSGSMRENDRLELVKHAVRLLVGELDGRDSIAIVAYSNEARLVLPLTPASQGGVIEAALYPLQPNGSTNAEAGLELGYQVARTGLDPAKNHRVVFLSDGVANVGQTDQDRIALGVKSHLDAGIYLNTIGVGMNNHNDVFLEQLADKGDGVCDYVDSPKAAQRAIVERFTGAFEPIASDVKVQVQFDPLQVHRYRLLGYENRAIADQDFRNDAVDAGEVGAGHQIVALYELELAGDASSEAPLATVRLRYKAPKGPGQDPRELDVTELEHPVALAQRRATFAEASRGFRRSAVVAQFAEFLRRSSHTYGDSFESLLAETAQLATELADPDFDEFLGLVRRAYQLGPPADYRGELDLTLDEFRRLQILRKELESLKKGIDGELLEKLQERNRELEDELRRLIQGELQKNG